jgi:hypothetical protein
MLSGDYNIFVSPTYVFQHRETVIYLFIRFTSQQASMYASVRLKTTALGNIEHEARKGKSIY